MSVRLLFAAAALLATCSVASARDLIVAPRAGQAPAVDSVFLKPFSGATGIPGKVEGWQGGMDELKTKAKENAWDVVEVDPDELGAGCGDGTLEKLDWSAIGGKDHYLPQAVSDCGVGSSIANTVLAWDRDKFGATPTWADFWDVAKYPGKRGLHKGVRGNLEIALLADGVAPGDIYKTLGSNDGLDRAFRKLDQLKPYIVWWSSGADAARILGSGDVLMTSAPSGRIATAVRLEHRNFGIQWAASLYEIRSWAIPKGSPNLRQAQQFLYFAGTPAIEGRLVSVNGNGGFAKGANDFLPPDLAPLAPTVAANLNAGIRMDSGFWRDNLAKLRQRFDAWLEGH